MRRTIKKTATTLVMGSLAFFILGISGCMKEAKAPVNNQNEAKINSGTQSNAALVITSNEKIPIDLPVFISCANGGAGEFVVLSGPLHVTTQVTINGNRVHFKEHFQPQGLSGIGETSGNKYQATGVTQDDFSGSFVNGQFQTSSVNNFKIIGQGPGNNFLIHENFHVTVNANGTVTTVIDNFKADCK
jgi:hypothetical protein